MYKFSAEKYNLIRGLELEIKDKVLDLGCGDGTLTKNLSSKVPMGKVIAIDVSENMIDAAKKIKSSNLQFKLMNINDMEFKEKFDLVFSNQALHYVKNHNRLLENCNEFLNYNGKIRFSFASNEHCKNFFQIIRETIVEKKYSIYFNNFEWPLYMPSMDEYKNLIYKTKNFKNIEIYCENENRYFNSEDKLVKWIDEKAIIPFVEVLPQRIKKSFRNKIVSKMLEITNQEDGIYLEKFSRINIIAQKA